MSSYLFVLCPPYCGSTLLWKLLSTSDSVSALPSEGQFLPELEELMRDKPWNAEHQLPWPQIKSVWESYWDHSKPVLLEKSPPNLIRTQEIVQHFPGARFLITVRNPYAHAEGLMRRNNWKVKRAANFSCMCLRNQLRNSQELENTLVLTYESLVADPAAASLKIAGFIPELSDMDHQASFEVHSVDGTVNRPITDLNAKKIASLEPETIAGLNETFALHQETIEAWGYEVINP
ncbi:MAG: hypothetical protein ACI9JM_002334 [Halioglobus sp.]|jgi:hypothetical protein